jgi:hypothetical protein
MPDEKVGTIQRFLARAAALLGHSVSAALCTLLSQYILALNDVKSASPKKVRRADHAASNSAFGQKPCTREGLARHL